MEPKKFVWVMGPSGVGKRTFVERAMEDPELRRRFELGDDLSAFGPGFQGQSAQGTKARALAAANSLVVLVKWQAIGDREVEQLRTLAPKAEHHLFLLQRPPGDNHRDLHRRTPSSTETQEGIAAFAANTLQACRERAERGFILTIIDASNDEYVTV